MDASGDLPKLAAPAQRALDSLGVASLADLARHTEAEVAGLHGMGPTALAQLRGALRGRGLRFRDERVDLIRAFLTRPNWPSPWANSTPGER